MSRALPAAVGVNGADATCLHAVLGAAAITVVANLTVVPAGFFSSIEIFTTLPYGTLVQARAVYCLAAIVGPIYGAIF